MVPASDEFHRLLITFANCLDPDQKNIQPYLGVSKLFDIPDGMWFTFSR